jgi:hypothetical protein
LELKTKGQFLFERGGEKKVPFEKPLKTQIGQTEQINKASPIFKDSVSVLS